MRRYTAVRFGYCPYQYGVRLKNNRDSYVSVSTLLRKYCIGVRLPRGVSCALLFFYFTSYMHVPCGRTYTFLTGVYTSFTNNNKTRNGG